VFIVYWLYQVCAWLVVGLTLERVLVVWMPYKMKVNSHKHKRNVIAYITLTAVVLLASDCHFLWNNEIVTSSPDNTTIISRCTCKPHMTNFYANIWPWIDLVIASLLPFILILIGNISIISRLVHAKKAHSMTSQNRKSRLGGTTSMLLSVSFMFILSTSPICILIALHNIFDPFQSGEPLVIARWSLGWSTVSLLSYVNNAINFWLYCVSGQKFRQQLALMICYKQEKVLSSTWTDKLSNGATTPKPSQTYVSSVTEVTRL